MALPPALCEQMEMGPTLSGPAAVVLCQLLGAHLPDIQVSCCRLVAVGRLLVAVDN